MLASHGFDESIVADFFRQLSSLMEMAGVPYKISRRITWGLMTPISRRPLMRIYDFALISNAIDEKHVILRHFRHIHIGFETRRDFASIVPSWA